MESIVFALPLQNLILIHLEAVWVKFIWPQQMLEICGTLRKFSELLLSQFTVLVHTMEFFSSI